MKKPEMLVLDHDMGGLGMEAKEFREKYLNGMYSGDLLEIQLEMNLIDVPEYPYAMNHANYIENTGRSCSPEVVLAPLRLVYGNGWLFGPRDNANPIPSMLAYWFERIKKLEDFQPIPDAFETLEGEYIVRNADHRILLAFIMGWHSIPLEIIKKNVDIAKADLGVPLRFVKKVKRYSM